MSLVDVLLVVVGLLMAVSGYRQGFVVGVLSFLGFVLGGVAGMLVVPVLLEEWAPGLGQVLVAVAVVVALATVGQLLLALLGREVRERLTWQPARVLDATAGALVSVLAVVVIGWFMASALRQAPLPALSREVGDSRILAQVDALAPDDAQTLFGSFRGVLGESGFPQVFGGLTPERILPVDPPEPGVTGTAQVERASGSVVEVSGEAGACGRTVEGSGFVFAAERVMTNAHVVAGVSEPRVRVGGEGRGLPGRVVHYDPARDLAVLVVPGLSAPALEFDPDAARGDVGVVAGFPRGGPYRLDAARVRERITARGPDIYSSAQVDRDVLSLYAVVQPGNSGGPLLSPEGRVLGVVFAKSLDDPVTGYALTVQEASGAIEAGRSATARVDTLGCAA